MDTRKAEKVALAYAKYRIPDAEVEKVLLVGCSKDRIILNIRCISANQAHSMTIQVQAKFKLYDVEAIL